MICIKLRTLEPVLQVAAHNVPLEPGPGIGETPIGSLSFQVRMSHTGGCTIASLLT